MTRATITAIFICITLLDVHAQVELERRYQETFAARLQGGVVYTLYDASFTSTGDIVDCGQLTNGTGWNPAIAATMEFPIASSLAIGVGIGYAGRSGLFSRENSYPTRDSSGVEGTLTSELTLDATMTYLEVQPDLRWGLIGDFHKRSLGLIFGPRIGLPLTNEFKQSETVTGPDGATFIVDGALTQQRTVAEGKLTTRSPVMIGLSAGIESLIPVSERVSIVPQLSFDYFFTDMVIDGSWKNYGVRAEIGIRLSTGRVTEPQQPPPPPPPVIIVPPQIALQFTSFSGEVVTGNHLSATIPIVDAVFFDSAQSTIPTTYRRTLDASTINADPVKAHEWLLPRIATLLEQNPDASIVLEGSSGGDVGGVTLGQERADAVKSALVRMGVSSSRIKTEARDLPRTPSNSAFAGGREENRRVDITVIDAPLQEWVTLERFATLRGTMQVRAELMSAGTSSDSARMSIRVNGKDSAFIGGSISARFAIEQDVPLDSARTTVRTSVSAEGVYSQRDTTIYIDSLPRREIDLQTQDFQAILRFDYNSSELTEDVQNLLRQLSERLPQGATITILGSADVLGSEARNKQLSEERAENTRTFIRSISNNKFKIEASTTAETFSDATPQGRFLNRSIRLTAQTP